jgi:hypothetical protein
MGTMGARAIILLATSAACLATVLGSCGDSTSTPESSLATSQEISKAEFIAQAGAACRSERADLKIRSARYRAEHRGEPRSEALTGFVQFVMLPTIEAEATRILHLPPPAREESAIKAILSAVDLGTDRVATMEHITSLDPVYSSFGEAEAQLKAFGLLACATGPHHQRYNSLY